MYYMYIYTFLIGYSLLAIPCWLFPIVGPPAEVPGAARRPARPAGRPRNNKKHIVKVRKQRS